MLGSPEISILGVSRSSRRRSGRSLRGVGGSSPSASARRRTSTTTRRRTDARRSGNQTGNGGGGGGNQTGSGAFSDPYDSDSASLSEWTFSCEDGGWLVARWNGMDGN